MPHPELCRPSFALDAWQNHIEVLDKILVPRLLFPIAYREPPSCLLVELEDGGGPAGAIFAYGYGGGGFALRFPGIAAYLDLVATMIDLGEVDRHTSEHGVRYRIRPSARVEGHRGGQLAMPCPWSSHRPPPSLA